MAHGRARQGNVFVLPAGAVIYLYGFFTGGKEGTNRAAAPYRLSPLPMPCRRKGSFTSRIIPAGRYGTGTGNGSCFGLITVPVTGQHRNSVSVSVVIRARHSFRADQSVIRPKTDYSEADQVHWSLVARYFNENLTVASPATGIKPEMPSRPV